MLRSVVAAAQVDVWVHKEQNALPGFNRTSKIIPQLGPSGDGCKIGDNTLNEAAPARGPLKRTVVYKETLLEFPSVLSLGLLCDLLG